MENIRQSGRMQIRKTWWCFSNFYRHGKLSNQNIEKCNLVHGMIVQFDIICIKPITSIYTYLTQKRDQLYVPPEFFRFGPTYNVMALI